jgi:hypothetical protein
MIISYLNCTFHKQRCQEEHPCSASAARPLLRSKGLTQKSSSSLFPKNTALRPCTPCSTSLRISWASGLYVGLICALIFGPVQHWIILFLKPNETIDNAYYFVGVGWGIGIGIAVGVVIALRNGGLACLQHVLVRFLLWRACSIPWNYHRFLDYAAERILLRKVGGGYIFIHRLLLDHFANLETESPLEISEAERHS